MSWKEKYKLVVFNEIDSTRLEAMRIAKTAPDQDYIILAKNQQKKLKRILINTLMESLIKKFTDTVKVLELPVEKIEKYKKGIAYMQ